jgi:hypothetical protein
MTAIGSNPYNNLELKDGVKPADFRAKVNKSLSEGPEGKGVITEAELQELAGDLKDPKNLNSLVNDLVEQGAVFDDNAISTLRKAADDSVNSGIKDLFEHGLADKKARKDGNPLYDKLAAPDSKLAKRLESLGIPKQEVEDFIITGKASPKVEELFMDGSKKLAAPKEMWGKPWEKFWNANNAGLEILDGLKTKFTGEKKELLVLKEKFKDDPVKTAEIDQKIALLDSKLKGVNDTRMGLVSAGMTNSKSWAATLNDQLMKGTAQEQKLCKDIAAAPDEASKEKLQKKLHEVQAANKKLSQALKVPYSEKSPETPKAQPAEPDKKIPDNKAAAKPEAKFEATIPPGATEVDDAEVQRIIDQAEKHGKDIWPANPVQAASSAWKTAYDIRQKNVNDVNWAAAEHYLYAKYSGKQDGVGGAALTGVMATGYDAVKAGLFLIGQENVISGDGSTPSKPTAGSTKWGIKGAVDGVN